MGPGAERRRRNSHQAGGCPGAEGDLYAATVFATASHRGGQRGRVEPVSPDSSPSAQAVGVANNSTDAAEYSGDDGSIAEFLAEIPFKPAIQAGDQLKRRTPDRARAGVRRRGGQTACISRVPPTAHSKLVEGRGAVGFPGSLLRRKEPGLRPERPSGAGCERGCILPRKVASRPKCGFPSRAARGFSRRRGGSRSANGHPSGSTKSWPREGLKSRRIRTVARPGWQKAHRRLRTPATLQQHAVTITAGTVIITLFLSDDDWECPRCARRVTSCI